MHSKLFKLNKFDFLKGAILAALTSILTYAYGCVNAGNFQFDYKLILQISVGSFLGYLLKNWLTNKDGKPLKPEDK